MATATSSYTTAFRYCQQPADSPAPSPGPSSTVRDQCRGHSPFQGNPDSGRLILSDAGQSLGEFQGQVFTLRAIRRNPARNPDHPGRPSPSRGQPWW